MSYRRLLNVALMLVLASVACAIGGSSPTSVPPTNAPAASKTPSNFHNGGLTPEAPTQAADTAEPPTKVPTKAVKPTKEPTQVADVTATPDNGEPTTCATFQASDVVWVTLDKNGKIDQTVTSYPDGTTTITPIFTYACNPKAFQIVTIFSLNGQQVYSAKETVKATDTKSAYGYPLGTQNGKPMDTGEWGVEFYNAKQLVASSKVQVGSGGNGNSNGNDNSNSNGNGSTSTSVTVQGTVTNKAGGKPVAGAVIAILNPGITIKQFIADNFPDSEIYTNAKSDSKGQFVLPSSLDRNTKYSIIVVATGFKAVEVDGFVIDDSMPDPLQLDVTMSK